MTYLDLERAVIDALTGVVSEAKTIEPYSGQFESEVEILLKRLPAIYLVYKGSSVEPVDGPNHNEICRFEVLVAAKNYRGKTNAFYDCYMLIRKVLNALTNQTFGLDIERIMPKEIALVMIGSGIIVYAIEFQTNFDTTYSW